MTNSDGIVRVLGVGNVLTGDDGLGPYAVRVLEARYELPAGVEVVDVGTPGLDFLPYLADTRAVVLVDTVSADGEPGSIVIYRQERLLSAPLPARTSPHQPGLRETLMAAELADTPVGEVVLVGVIPAEIGIEPGLSQPVRSAVDGAVAAVLTELERFGVVAEARAQVLEPDIWWERGGDGARH